jgi:serine/threonine-protein kinase RsbW
MMTANPSSADATRCERLSLQGRLADLTLVPPWVAYLASAYSIPENTRYAMDLCLEELLSNIIRHGYRDEFSRPIIVHYSTVQDLFLLVIDDEAPPFNPLLWKESLEESLSGTRIGGFGLNLVRNFARTVEYERTPMGNRLTLTFSSGTNQHHRR